jgi:hypothetical protein
MATAVPDSNGPRTERSGLVSAYRVAASLTAVLVLVQAILAGRGLFRDADLIDVHGYVGNAVFLLVVVQGGLAVALRGPAGRSGVFLALNGALIALTVAQIGLGYAGRESGEAAAWHVPNGVLIFGLAVANLALLFRLPAAPARS